MASGDELPAKDQKEQSKEEVRCEKDYSNLLQFNLSGFRGFILRKINEKGLGILSACHMLTEQFRAVFL